jgi:predicted small lipoprotein YifL
VVRRAVLSLAAILVLALTGCGGSGPKPNPDAGTIADPLAYDGTRQAEFEARATAGLTPVLVEKSPGGVMATARRVARWRPLIVQAARSGPVDADTLEALVFLESAGRQYAQAGSLEGAAGLTQIVAQTATGLLGMHVDLAKARKAKTARALRRADDRFVPAKALAATERYLRFAKGKVGRTDLAIASYHMGVGNLQRALSLYGASDIPYAQLYFDSTPLTHSAAWRLLYSLGDDSSTYLWRVLAAKRLMALYRTDRPALATVIAGTIPPPPGPPRALAEGHGLRFPKGAQLLPRAATVAETIGDDVRRIAATEPLTIRSASGHTFYVSRAYRSHRQAVAFQFMLDRLSALSLIDWGRRFDLIAVQVR